MPIKPRFFDRQSTVGFPRFASNSETKSTSAQKDARRALCHGCVARGAGPGGKIRTLATLTNLSEGEDPDDPEGGEPRGRDGH